MAPSSLRLTPAIERPWSRMDRAVDERGGCRICPCLSFRALRAGPAVFCALPIPHFKASPWGEAGARSAADEGTIMRVWQ